MALHFVIDRAMFWCSTSWLGQMSAVRIALRPAMMSTGLHAFQAEAIPGTELANPGPAVTSARPRVTVGRMNHGRLVALIDDANPGVVEGAEDDVEVTAEAEDRVDALPFDGAGRQLRPRHLRLDRDHFLLAFLTESPGSSVCRAGGRTESCLEKNLVYAERRLGQPAMGKRPPGLVD